MLVELRIRDHAVLRDVVLEPGPGLTILTGETGAGKSIIVGALSLLLGERASTDAVRRGAERSVIEGVFDVRDLPEVATHLGELGIEGEEDLVILRREVAAEGRSRAWINGAPATVAMLGTLGRLLVDLHGQHEHQALLTPAEQRRILDAFAGAAGLAGEVAALHDAWTALAAKIRDGDRRRAESRERADFLRFRASEIADAGLEEGEEERLSAELLRLEHAESLLAGSREIGERLYSGEEAFSDGLAVLRDRLRSLVVLDSRLGEPLAALEEAYHLVTETGRTLESHASAVELDPERLEEVRARLDRLSRLKRKYGPTLAEVIAEGARLREELASLETAEEERGEAERRLAGLEKEMRVAAAGLGELRRGAAHRLAEAAMAILPTLGMPNAVLRIELEPIEPPGRSGAERVEFLASPNRGFDVRPLSRIASGGELSRFMLALKSVLATEDRVPLLIFDEIDAGVGGEAAVGVADQLRHVASHHQVLVITHLPQVAARGDRHVRIEKGESDGMTTTSLVRLEGEARVVEIARMLGGDPDSRLSRDHARELLGEAVSRE